ncbi:MAG: outer membrane beta-barrel protein [Saprospiraceae bacterium]|nr:outer membrane beta-barrel protein [Saprospiraceae bacterium]
MKNLLTLFLALALSSNLFAQEAETASNWIVGGTLNFTSQKNTIPFSFLGVFPASTGTIFSSSTTDTKNLDFQIRPYLGYELTKQLMLGFQGDLRLGKYEGTIYDFNEMADVPFERKTNQFGFGSFFRYTFNPENAFSVFVQPGVHYTFGKEKEEIMRFGEHLAEYKSNYFRVVGALGATYQISTRIRMIASMGAVSYLIGSYQEDPLGQFKDFSQFNTNLRLSSIGLGLELRI